jgi:hypothetical protein
VNLYSVQVFTDDAQAAFNDDDCVAYSFSGSWFRVTTAPLNGEQTTYAFHAPSEVRITRDATTK